MDDRAIGEAFVQVYRTVARLRAPDGCPWDRAQTHLSLRAYLLEEAYEVLDALEAVEHGGAHMLREELGDLLLQVLLHGVIAAERGHFDITDVLRGLDEKLVRRHPHVFGDVRVRDAEAVARNWERIKREESGEPEDASLMAGLPGGDPPLRAAYRAQRRAARVGFDWDGPDAALQKVREEAAELLAARAAGDERRVEDEAGDLLFATVNVVRLCGVDPDVALARAVRKFVRRFRAMERRAGEEGRRLDELSPAELDRLWEGSKAEEAP